MKISISVATTALPYLIKISFLQNYSSRQSLRVAWKYARTSDSWQTKSERHTKLCFGVTRNRKKVLLDWNPHIFTSEVLYDRNMRQTWQDCWFEAWLWDKRLSRQPSSRIWIAIRPHQSTLISLSPLNRWSRQKFTRDWFIHFGAAFTHHRHSSDQACYPE